MIIKEQMEFAIKSFIAGLWLICPWKMKLGNSATHGSHRLRDWAAHSSPKLWEDICINGVAESRSAAQVHMISDQNPGLELSLLSNLGFRSREKT